MKIRSLKQPLSLLVGLVLASVVLGFVWGAYWLRHRSMTEDGAARIEAVEKLVEVEIQKDINMFHSVALLIARDERLRSMWLARDREALLQNTQDLLVDLKKHNRITHFYFHDIDRVNFLRVHYPDRHGDRIERFTMSQSAATHKMASGVEVGPLGTMTFRHVEPWIFDGQLIGYIELGKEIDYITRHAADTIGVEILVALDKHFLQRDTWKQGQKMLGRIADWEHLPNSVLAENNSTAISTDVLRQFDRNASLLRHQLVNVSDADATYLAGTVPLLDARGRHVGNFFVFHDITAPMASLSRLAFALVGLSITTLLVIVFAYLFMHRTHRNIEITEHDSQHHRRQLERAEDATRSMSNFLANMSHEIRTPLNATLGYTDLLRQDDEKMTPNERREHLDTIHASGQHLLTLINDILDLSKIESEQIEIERIRFSYHQIVAEVLSLLRVPALEKGIVLECECSEGTPETIESDPARLRQLLLNLVGNAIKFTDQGNVRIVSRLVQNVNTPKLVIEVIDTGIGIAPENLDKIFDPFAQADSSIARKYGGTGLGLAICRHIAEALGDGLDVRSTIRKGTIFRFSIDTGSLDDIRIEPCWRFESLKSDMPIEKTDRKISPSTRVLLVEDGETNRKLISLILKREGIDVTSAENGRIGADLALEQSFDLILMDMQMPVMNGYEATTCLREQGIQIPIIALTAHAMKGDRETCEAAGCSGYLTKPIDADQLIRTLANALPEVPVG